TIGNTVTIGTDSITATSSLTIAAGSTTTITSGTNQNIALTPGGTGLVTIGGDGLVLATKDTKPGSGTVGQMVYDTAEDKMYIWDNAQWNEIAGSGGGGATTLDMTNNSGQTVSQKKVIGVMTDSETCTNGSSCEITVAGDVIVNNADAVSRGDYLYTSATQGKVTSSAKQHDGLFAIAKTAASSSATTTAIIVTQPSVLGETILDRAIITNIMVNSFRQQEQGTSTWARFEDGWADEFEDSTHIDASLSTDYTYDTTDDYLYFGLILLPALQLP
ncbi:MAG: DUF2190 family protein, partial [Deltaproteobacteria bacterium]|nr:DUF2190 family protein [Deltaproteobacteria bacterium]